MEKNIFNFEKIRFWKKIRFFKKKNVDISVDSVQAFGQLKITYKTNIEAERALLYR